ncbi:Rieske (2Fe-2S) protein [Aurantiacibacter rhizosphaerae]|uniref:Rieske 2Fe-2S domain-containing protein n=1 Tax=Aurantiacibacter rhizosphaerae TaxID=2691582 RepID=A0A844XIC5_9SPHN|nr:Rieske 2Fe-2S domain-containing protein [Aurantiacibacter rhizosphaerae]MWV29298.1 Rieske 2Fe-2S domain-containing protein [Aurantiacibacter rhizosphaerae]
MTDYVRVCETGEIPNGSHRAFDVGDISVLILRVNREFHAVRNRCTHLDFPLEGGRQMGCEIICRKHGARFDTSNGRALTGPAVDRLAVYPTRIVEGWIEVAVPRPAAD